MPLPKLPAAAAHNSHLPDFTKACLALRRLSLFLPVFSTSSSFLCHKVVCNPFFAPFPQTFPLYFTVIFFTIFFFLLFLNSPPFEWISKKFLGPFPDCFFLGYWGPHLGCFHSRSLGLYSGFFSFLFVFTKVFLIPFPTHKSPASASSSIGRRRGEFDKPLLRSPDVPDFPAPPHLPSAPRTRGRSSSKLLAGVPFLNPPSGGSTNCWLILPCYCSSSLFLLLSSLPGICPWATLISLRTLWNKTSTPFVPNAITLCNISSKQQTPVCEALLPLLSSPACRLCSSAAISASAILFLSTLFDRERMRSLFAWAPLGAPASPLLLRYCPSAHFFFVLDALYLLQSLLHFQVVKHEIMPSFLHPLQLVLQGLFDTLLCFFRDKRQSSDISQLLLQFFLFLIQFFLTALGLILDVHVLSPHIFQISFIPWRDTLPSLHTFSSILFQGINPCSEFLVLCFQTPGLSVFLPARRCRARRPLSRPRGDRLPVLPTQPCRDVTVTAPATPPRPHIRFWAEFARPLLSPINRDRHEPLFWAWKPSLTIPEHQLRANEVKTTPTPDNRWNRKGTTQTQNKPKQITDCEQITDGISSKTEL